MSFALPYAVPKSVLWLKPTTIPEKWLKLTKFTS